MTTMIALLLPKQQLLMVQINDPDAAAFNLIFHLSDSHIWIDSNFQIPTATQHFTLYGDRVTKTVSKLVRAWPKLIDGKLTLSDLLMAVAKKYKVDHFQINVNADFSDKHKQPFTRKCVDDLRGLLASHGFSTTF